MIGVAGSAMPPQFVESYQKKYGVHMMLAWGMTELTPIGTVTSLKSHLRDLPDRERFELLARHGFPLAGVDIRVVDPNGDEVPWDGTTMGELQARGPWVAGEYYKDPHSRQCFADGWLWTGDVATVDAEGYIQITDRTQRPGEKWRRMDFKRGPEKRHYGAPQSSGGSGDRCVSSEVARAAGGLCRASSGLQTPDHKR
jgi:acyl-CoA synthetase (AMP-forming)/AMP-acid ligase II